jgi:opacity protein-like surface antigen
MKKLLSVLAVVAFTLSVPALAAIQQGNGELGVDFGQQQFDSNTGFDTGTSLGLRGGYFFNKNVELEGQLASSSETVDQAGTSVDGHFRSYMVNGVYNFNTPKDIVPYALAGVGIADNSVDAAGVTASDSGTAFQIGAGSRFYFGKAKKAAFRVDLSMIRENTFNENSTHTNASAGFTWRLGGK